MREVDKIPQIADLMELWERREVDKWPHKIQDKKIQDRQEKNLEAEAANLAMVQRLPLQQA